MSKWDITCLNKQKLVTDTHMYAATCTNECTQMLINMCAHTYTCTCTCTCTCTHI